MDYIVTLTGGNSFKVPDTAVDTQRKVHKNKIQSIVPADYKQPQPEELPSAVPDFDSMKTLKELQQWCEDNIIPPSEWKSITKVLQLRKILKQKYG